MVFLSAHVVGEMGITDGGAGMASVCVLNSVVRVELKCFPLLLPPVGFDPLWYSVLAQLGLNVADVTEAGFRTSQEMVDDLAAVSSALHSIVLVSCPLWWHACSAHCWQSGRRCMGAWVLAMHIASVLHF